MEIIVIPVVRCIYMNDDIGAAVDGLAKTAVDDFVDKGCTGVFWRFGTELSRFRNMKLKNFSRGMYERLAYGAAELPHMRGAEG